MSTTAPKLMTADELLRLNDGLRHELVKGELLTMTPAGTTHGMVAARLARLLGNWVDERGLGYVLGAETGFKLATDPDTVRAPDASFVAMQRIPPEGVPEKYWPGAPDLAAEVVSPGDSYEEVRAKVQEWLEAGTRLVWVVRPRARQVEVHTPDGRIALRGAEDELDGGDVLPGFACRVAALFP